MKTLLLLATAALFVSADLKGQIIPNSGFEQWHQVAGWYDAPADWKTNNNQLVTPVKQETAAAQGSLAVRINSGGQITCRFPISFTNANLTMQLKANIVAGDSIVMQMWYYNNGTEIKLPQWALKNSIATWSLFSMQVMYIAPGSDSLQIRFSGGSQAQSTVAVDDVMITPVSPTAIKNETIVTDFFVYPSPCYGSFMVGSSDPEVDEIRLYDLTGKMVKAVCGYQSGEQIVCNDLCNGLYYLQLYADSRLAGSTRLLIGAGN